MTPDLMMEPVLTGLAARAEQAAHLLLEEGLLGSATAMPHSGMSSACPGKSLCLAKPAALLVERVADAGAELRQGVVAVAQAVATVVVGGGMLTEKSWTAMVFRS
mmetsp:Transcript_15633/g.35506  ORF Transcript_15633/g.35506 Transcript_15633/m.35506 type:complete len:105 (-) Transcript_15633:302-616(-)